jgi:selenide,water dikinase
LENVGDGKIGMDCSVVPLPNDLFIISTTDFFYPLVEDPYLQGKIACANVLSDLYACGVVECDTMLMLLASSRDMTPKQRDVATKLMIEGFNDLAKEANTMVTGGQTVLNPWPIIGGVATSVKKSSEFIMPENAVAGDVIVLTKALGTQVAVNLHQWLHQEKWNNVKDIITTEEVMRGYELAEISMARLNKTGAKLMHKYKAHGATDVTGFGIIGHANNLCRNQKATVNFEIHTLPIIKGMKKVDEQIKMFNLLEGKSSETSGGLLICLRPEEAKTFCEEIEAIEHYPAWIIGRVLSRDTTTHLQNTAYIVKDPIILEI